MGRVCITYLWGGDPISETNKPPRTTRKSGEFGKWESAMRKATNERIKKEAERKSRKKLTDTTEE